MLQPLNELFGIGEEITKDPQLDEVIDLPIKEISPNRYQPRSIFDLEKIAELAQTISTHGVIQPIIVRKKEGAGYELVAGERRWRAVKSLGWKTVPVIIRTMNDTEAASVSLIENLQREELTVIEEATAYSKLLELHSLTQEALAKRLGKAQSTIANKLRLLKLPQGIQIALLEKRITERHARALISLKDEVTQIRVLNEIIELELNVAQTEKRVKEINNPIESLVSKKGIPQEKQEDLMKAMDTIRDSLIIVSDQGIKVETEEAELDEYYQFTIKIPK